MTLPLPAEDVFRFFGDAMNLQRITPPQLHFRVLTPPPIEITQGTVLDYRLRLFGVPFRWRSRITRWQPPEIFVDEQVRGPYKRWIHTHRFIASPGKTVIEDEVRYSLRGWPLGEIFIPFVKWQLNGIFRYRRETIEAHFLDAGGSKRA